MNSLKSKLTCIIKLIKPKSKKYFIDHTNIDNE